MTIFYLVRHAHSDWTPDENWSLSAQGCKDADRVTNTLCVYPISVIYSSPAPRAYQTISPLAERLDLSIHIDLNLQERRLGDEVSEDFFKAVEVTWRNPSFAYPGGESNTVAQKRGTALVQRLVEKHPEQHIVLSTHGTLMALVLQSFNLSVDFMFWKSLTMPDVYKLILSQPGKGVMERLWDEKCKILTTKAWNLE